MPQPAAGEVTARFAARAVVLPKPCDKECCARRVRYEADWKRAPGRRPTICRTVAPALLMSERAPFPEDPFALLEHGAIEAVELIPWGSNYTFAALLVGKDGSRCYGVYKPRRGEVPLRDFPSGTLYKREVAAYQLAKHLGWDMIPPTIVRKEGPHGVGSLQLYVEPRAGSSAQYERLRESHRCDLQRMAAFDLLVNNADRK